MAHNLFPGNPNVVQAIVEHLKSHGIFDQFRRDCLADMDTTPAYMNLKQRVDGYTSKFLSGISWSPALNRNQLRESLRKEIQESGVLMMGVDHLIEQVIVAKMQHAIVPEVENITCEFLGIPIEKIRRSTQLQSVMLPPSHSIEHLPPPPPITTFHSSGPPVPPDNPKRPPPPPEENEQKHPVPAVDSSSNSMMDICSSESEQEDTRDDLPPGVTESPEKNMFMSKRYDFKPDTDDDVARDSDLFNAQPTKSVSNFESEFRIIKSLKSDDSKSNDVAIDEVITEQIPDVQDSAASDIDSDRGTPLLDEPVDDFVATCNIESTSTHSSKKIALDPLLATKAKCDLLTTDILQRPLSPLDLEVDYVTNDSSTGLVIVENTATITSSKTTSMDAESVQNTRSIEVENIANIADHVFEEKPVEENTKVSVDDQESVSISNTEVKQDIEIPTEHKEEIKPDLTVKEELGSKQADRDIKVHHHSSSSSRSHRKDKNGHSSSRDGKSSSSKHSSSRHNESGSHHSSSSSRHKSSSSKDERKHSSSKDDRKHSTSSSSKHSKTDHDKHRDHHKSHSSSSSKKSRSESSKDKGSDRKSSSDKTIKDSDKTTDKSSEKDRKSDRHHSRDKGHHSRSKHVSDRRDTQENDNSQNQNESTHKANISDTTGPSTESNLHDSSKVYSAVEMELRRLTGDSKDSCSGSSSHHETSKRKESTGANDTDAELSFKDILTVAKDKETTKSDASKASKTKSNEPTDKLKNTADKQPADGHESDVTVSSVHTSDLSSFDDRISLSEEEQEIIPEKKAPLNVVKRVTGVELLKSDSDRLSHTSSRSNRSTTSKKSDEISGNTLQQSESSKFGRQRRVNPKYVSEEFSSIFTEGTKNQQHAILDFSELTSTRQDYDSQPYASRVVPNKKQLLTAASVPLKKRLSLSQHLLDAAEAIATSDGPSSTKDISKTSNTASTQQEKIESDGNGRRAKKNDEGVKISRKDSNITKELIIDRVVLAMKAKQHDLSKDSKKGGEVQPELKKRKLRSDSNSSDPQSKKPRRCSSDYKERLYSDDASGESLRAKSQSKTTSSKHKSAQDEKRPLQNFSSGDSDMDIQDSDDDLVAPVYEPLETIDDEELKHLEKSI